MPPKNLVFWMSNDDDEAADERTSDLIAQRKVPVHGDPDKPATTYVDVASWVPADTKGLLEITLVSAGAARHRAAAAHRPAAGGQAHRHGRPARSPVPARASRCGRSTASTLEPARGVEVSLLRKSGFTPRHLQHRRRPAAARCRCPSPALDKALPFALLASSGRDLTYLKFADLRADVDEARVSGEPYRGGEKKYAAAVYGDRGVYRPGETAHLVAIVRDADARGAAGGHAGGGEARRPARQGDPPAHAAGQRRRRGDARPAPSPPSRPPASTSCRWRSPARRRAATPSASRSSSPSA